MGIGRHEQWAEPMWANAFVAVRGTRKTAEERKAQRHRMVTAISGFVAAIEKKKPTNAMSA